jgi:hypothetical protein
VGKRRRKKSNRRKRSQPPGLRGSPWELGGPTTLEAAQRWVALAGWLPALLAFGSLILAGVVGVFFDRAFFPDGIRGADGRPAPHPLSMVFSLAVWALAVRFLVPWFRFRPLGVRTTLAADDSGLTVGHDGGDGLAMTEILRWSQVKSIEHHALPASRLRGLPAPAAVLHLELSDGQSRAFALETPQPQLVGALLEAKRRFAKVAAKAPVIPDSTDAEARRSLETALVSQAGGQAWLSQLKRFLSNHGDGYRLPPLPVPLLRAIADDATASPRARVAALVVLAQDAKVRVAVPTDAEIADGDLASRLDRAAAAVDDEAALRALEDDL